MRLIWLDYLRVTAAFAVVCTHVSSLFYNAYNQVDAAEWWFANIINASSRFAVPIFIMISGCVLLGRSQHIGEFYLKRIGRIIPPLIFWSLLFAVVNYHIYGLPGFVQADEGRAAWLTIAVDMLLLFIVTGSTAVHLWYLTMLICLLLFVPFINKLVIGERLGFTDMMVLVVLGALFTGLNLCASIAEDLAGVTIDWFTRFPWYVLYLILGYLIYQFRDRLKTSFGTALVVICAVVIVGAVANFVMVFRHELIKDWLVLSNEGVLSFFLVLSIYIVFVRASDKFRESRLIMRLSEASFGIYLIHPVFILLFQLLFPAYLENTWLYLPLIILLTLTLSFLSITAFRRFQWLRLVV